ncbi:hypothetical protein C7S16_4480 [Burkholderia thailandensis]|uniref:Uncharacterized protein n=1 Tax=Burkholderia thailandensis TaxID=57975 RepID=A0AAW9CTR6_BURTH|nr:hypothetical protein [Burkholderia thailandensis]MDW9253281.1 hypothetical protein [Burkholderia thailandensis]
MHVAIGTAESANGERTAKGPRPAQARYGPMLQRAGADGDRPSPRAGVAANLSADRDARRR